MYVIHKDYKASSSVLSSTEDSDLGSFSDNIETKTKPFIDDHGFVPRAGGLATGFVKSFSLAKSQSICTMNDKPASPNIVKTDTSEVLPKVVMRRASHMEAESDAEPELKAKLNSLISIMVSTIMCLAAKCPVPRSNIQATKLFLSTVVNDNGESPRNIKGFLTLLKNYDGPYDGETPKVMKCETSPSNVEAVPNATEVVLEPAVPPTVQPVRRVRASRTRSRLPSLSPVKRNPDQWKQSWNT